MEILKIYIEDQLLIKYFVIFINIAKNPENDGCQNGLASMVYKFFNKKTSGGAVKSKIIPNQQSAEELLKPNIRKIEKRKVHLPCIDNTCSADLADLQLISKCNEGFRFLLCVIDIYSKYVWAVPLEDKKRYYNY